MSANNQNTELLNEKATISVPTPFASEDAKDGVIISIDDEEERRILKKIDWQ